MTDAIKKNYIDLILLAGLVPLVLGGLFTMSSFTGESGFFERQIIWIAISLVVFLILSFVDFRFMRKTGPVTILYLSAVSILSILLFLGTTIKGAKSWFSFGFFSFQPADLAKFALIFLLAKYFSKRHVEIQNIRHILISGAYAGLLCILVLLQPDFGSAIIILAIWFGMVMVSGISKKHFFGVLLTGLIVFGVLWQFGFKEYQKQRIINFIHPLSDIRGSGYNAYQSTIAVGSGEILGKGVGFGTQSRLNFLPEYETDFIFAAFAEEWGFVGVIFLFTSFGLVVTRVLVIASRGETNFEILYGTGIAIFFISHFIVNVGMNIGLMPVTGIPLPFVSYGGSHMLVCFISLGVLMGMNRYSRSARRETIKNEFLGI